MNRKPLQRILGLAACLAVAACAGRSERPDAAIAKADASIRSAETAGGREYGGPELDMARTKLAQAKSEADHGSGRDALRLAEQATLDAELSGAKGQSGKSTAALAQLRASNATLEQELRHQEQIRQQQSSPVIIQQESAP